MDNLTDDMLPVAELIKHWEGWRPDVYRDPSKTNNAVGWGFNVDRNPGIPKHFSSESQALPYLAKFANKARLDAMSFAGPKWGDLTENQQSVLTGMAYNMNKGGLFRYKGLRQAIMSGDMNWAQQELFDSKRYYDQGQKLPGLGKRVEEEAALWLK
jgi:GH24 family phage-related lysozyme (muramidase)